jgi:hypothetical protein
MRTPGHDFDLAAGFLVSEGVITRSENFSSARYCAGATDAGLNLFNVLDVSLAPGVAPPDPRLERSFYTTSSCGLCGKTSIDAVRTHSAYEVRDDGLRVDTALLSTFPPMLRAEQAVFEKTCGLHAAALFDGGSGKMLVLREDVGRHNAAEPCLLAHFLARYADALDALAEVVTDFGRHDDDARATLDRRVGQTEGILAELREVVRATPLEDPELWPVYGSLITDAQRAVRELDSARSRAVLPTDDGRRSSIGRGDSRARGGRPPFDGADAPLKGAESTTSAAGRGLL